MSRFRAGPALRTGVASRNRHNTLQWAVAAAAVTLIASTGCTTGQQSTTPGDATGGAKPRVIDASGTRNEVDLPFPQRSSFSPHGIAVDNQGTVYVAAINDGVLQLATAASEATRVPFTNVDFAVSTAVDGAGNIYLADDGHGGKGRVQKITNDGRPSELAITGLGQDPSIAAGKDGTVYVADGSNDRVLRVEPAGGAVSALPLVGLSDPRFVAVNDYGDVVVSDRSNGRVLLLPHGSNSQTVLPFDPDIRANGVAIDNDGNVYAADSSGIAAYVVKTAKTLDIPTDGIQPYDVAVDKVGNLLVTDFKAHRVVALRRTSTQ